MRRSTIKHWIAGLVMMAALAAGTGCDPVIMVGNSISFALGAILASQFQTTSADIHCYRGGVEVDCPAETASQP
jgi:hypothetical protein